MKRTTILLAVALAAPAVAQTTGGPAAPSPDPGWHNHGGAHMHRGGHGRGGNNPYAKAKIEERDRLLDKLKNMKICRGC